MYIALLMIGSSFAWLLYETKFLTIHLEVLTANSMPIAEVFNSTVPYEFVRTGDDILDGELEAELSIVKLPDATLWDHIEDYKNELEWELGVRSVAYHAGVHNRFPGYTTKRLDAMLKVYNRALGV